jgi:FtsP/CotA-like multicopper oxidase with cupredoxin domain
VSVGPTGSQAPDASASPPDKLDLMTYGVPDDLGTLSRETDATFDPATADRHFSYRIGRRPGFLDGRPGLWWTINGHMYPNVPMFVVEEGDVVVMDIENNSGRTHPMHLHGHHAVVLSHDGEKASGSPWWVDSLEVPSGEDYRIAFLADNPGIWMDHCHMLDHAAQGLVAHLMYAGVDTPFRVGDDAKNHPE